MRLPSSHLPRPAVPDPVSVLAYRHSAAHGHLLLPSRPEPSTKPPLEFVLIPRSRGWPRSPNAPRLLIFRAGGDSAEPPSPRRPLFSQSVTSRPHTASPRPRSVRARSRSAHAQEMRTRGDAHRGETGPSGQERVGPTGCPVRFSSVPGIPIRLELLKRALLQECVAQDVSSRFPRPQAKGS